MRGYFFQISLLLVCLFSGVASFGVSNRRSGLLKNRNSVVFNQQHAMTIKLPERLSNMYLSAKESNEEDEPELSNAMKEKLMREIR